MHRFLSVPTHFLCNHLFKKFISPLNLHISYFRCLSSSQLQFQKYDIPKLNLTIDESFMTGNNALYLEELYSKWTKDPISVHKVSN